MEMVLVEWLVVVFKMIVRILLFLVLVFFKCLMIIEV